MFHFLRLTTLSFMCVALLGACGKLPGEGAMGNVAEKLEEWQDRGDKLKERVQSRLGGSTPSASQLEELVGQGTNLPQLLAALEGNTNFTLPQFTTKLREILQELARAPAGNAQVAEEFQSMIEDINEEFSRLSRKPGQSEIQALIRRVRALLLQFIQFASQFQT